MEDRQKQQYLDFAVEAAWRAGRATLAYFQSGVEVEFKADHSPVTRADRESEQLLRGLIERDFPDHGIIGEEFGSSAGTQNLTWILDPIDGTKSFVRGVPLYGVLIALAQRASNSNRLRSIVGVAHFPALNETVWATSGLGCFWNGRRSHVSAVDRLDKAILLSSEVVMKGDPRKQEGYNRLTQATPIHRTWGDAYGYALVATGRGEIMLDAAMEIWDCAACQVILEEAGGTFTDWRGNPTIDGRESIATNGHLAQAVMALVNPT